MTNFADQPSETPEVGRLSKFRGSFRALSNPAFRVFFIGQAASRTGTRMQDVAQGWYVLERTGSGTAVGLLLATEYLPLLFLGAWGGSLVDRGSTRKILVVTQLIAAILAICLALATTSHSSIAWVYIVAAIRGLIGCLDLPAGQAFFSEMVPPEHIRSAVSLSSFLFNIGRLLGPLLATATIALLNTPMCFVINAVTFFILTITLLMMKPDHLSHAAPASTAATSAVSATGVRVGISYAWHQPELRALIVIMGCAGTFAYNSQTVFPLLARDTFGGGINMYAYVLASYSVGYLITILVSAAGNLPSNKQILTSAWLLAGSLVFSSWVVGFGPIGLVAIALFGAINAVFGSQANTALRIHTAPQMMGRIMGLWTIMLWGTTPIGAPLVGWIGEHYDPRLSLLLAGLAVAVGTTYASFILRNRP